MEDKDQLKEILKNINHINEPLNLEKSIMQLIQKDELNKQKIRNYRKHGIRGIIVSFLLVLILVCIFSFSESFQTLESTPLKYTSIVTGLIILFVQLELGILSSSISLKNK